MTTEGKNIMSKCCDTCLYYEWYYDKCTKFNCKVDYRSCCSMYKSCEESEEE